MEQMMVTFINESTQCFVCLGTTHIYNVKGNCNIQERFCLQYFLTVYIKMFRFQKRVTKSMPY